MKTGDLRVLGDLNAGVWQRIYSSGELAAEVTALTISGLDGNTDKIWLVKCRFVAGANTSTFQLRPNNDSTATSYGYQGLDGTNVTVTSARDTSEGQFRLGYANASGDICQNEFLLYAK